MLISLLPCVFAGALSSPHSPPESCRPNPDILDSRLAAPASRPRLPGFDLGCPGTRGALDLDHFSVGVPAEVDLVGLAVGLRPELTWRPFGALTATHLRVATGLMGGPELAFVPVSLGVRGRWFPRQRVHPMLGFVAELQTFWTAGHPPVARPSYGVELGVDVTVTGPWSVGLVLEPGFAPKPDFGFGMAARLGVTRAL